MTTTGDAPGTVRRGVGFTLATACLLLPLGQVAVASTPAPLAVSLVASPSSVSTGGAATLTWSTSGAAQCQTMGNWTPSGVLNSSGSVSTGALTKTSSYMLICTSSSGVSKSITATVKVTANSPLTVSLVASPSSVSTGGAATLTWSTSGAAQCQTMGNWTPSGVLNSSGSVSTGALTKTSSYMLICTNPSGVSKSATATVAVTASNAGDPPRPAYNTGNGFFVLNGGLYDSNGNAFRIRGVNRVHWDSNSAAGIALSGANTVRTFMDFAQQPANNIALIQTQNIDRGEVPVATYAGNSNGGTACNTARGTLNGAVAAWVSQAAQWTSLNKYLIVNIANEWGPANNSGWRSGYITAIATLRAAGYTGPLLIDSGGCGQDDADLLQYSQAVFDSDPERNVMFALHLYGTTNDYSASIQSVRRGFPTVITLAGNTPTHPFARGYNGSNSNWSGISAYQLSGVQGMTELNGEQPAVVNVGGVPGAWTVTLSVDSSNWGAYSGGGTLVDYNGNYALRIARLAALSRQTGAVYVIGEFGPGNNIGPSPTLVTPAEIITAAEANGIGWMAWAWDDNDLGGGQSNDNWFSMTYAGPGVYTQPGDLTLYGRDVVLNPSYGLSVLARRASIF
jgi:hypothetical protein